MQVRHLGHEVQPEPGAAPAFYVAPVILHEIGHALGLTHSSHPEEVMAPTYAPHKVELAEGDRARVRALYGVAPPHERRAAAEYLTEHKQMLETDLSAAVSAAIAARAPRPLRHVAELLMGLEERRAAGGEAPIS